MFLFITLTIFINLYKCDFNEYYQWRYLSGTINVLNPPAVYGTKNVFDILNIPSGRVFASPFQMNNSLYIFGGQEYYGGVRILNDFWEYSLSSLQWRWIAGSNLVNQAGSYGTKLIFSASNTPGARTLSGASQNNESFFLFAGRGYDNSSVTTGLLNDLWEFDPILLQWR